MKCIYCLDFDNGRRYIGATSNLKRRLIEHKAPNCNKKCNPELKEAILQDDYKVVILEQLPDDATRKDMVMREQHYYDLWSSSGILYNKCKRAAGDGENGGWNKGKKTGPDPIKREKNPAYSMVEDIISLKNQGLSWREVKETLGLKCGINVLIGIYKERSI